MTDTAIRATFADFKLVKTRGSAQFIFETPIEDADAALRVLGGLPQFSKELWVAIAPLAEQGKPAQTEKPKREFTLAQRAGMLCQDAQFQGWLDSETSEETADVVRFECKVKSRADIKPGTPAGYKFETMMTEFDAWRGRIGRPQ